MSPNTFKTHPLKPYRHQQDDCTDPDYLDPAPAAAVEVGPAVTSCTTITNLPMTPSDHQKISWSRAWMLHGPDRCAVVSHNEPARSALSFINLCPAWSSQRAMRDQAGHKHEGVCMIKPSAQMMLGHIFLFLLKPCLLTHTPCTWQLIGLSAIRYNICLPRNKAQLDSTPLNTHPVPNLTCFYVLTMPCTIVRSLHLRLLHHGRQTITGLSVSHE